MDIVWPCLVVVGWWVILGVIATKIFLVWVPAYIKFIACHLVSNPEVLHLS